MTSALGPVELNPSGSLTLQFLPIDPLTGQTSPAKNHTAIGIMSRLEQLPQGIRRNIFRYLLVAGRVRQPPSRFLIEGYNFEVALLHVSRTINSDAAAVLYGENTFVGVRFGFGPQTEEALSNHEVPFFKPKYAFNRATLDIVIKTKMSQTEVTILLLIDDITKFTRALRILDFANFVGYDFDFTLRQTPVTPITIQEQLFLPFQQVRGAVYQQEVSFSGPVDPALVARVTTAVTQNVAWLRGGLLEIHDLALSMKRNGDWAFEIGNVDMAQAKYDDARFFLEAALKQNNKMQGIDSHLIAVIQRLEIFVWTDTALVMLSGMMKAYQGRRRWQDVVIFSKTIEKAAEVLRKCKKDMGLTEVLVRFYYLLGIAELGLEHPNKAGKAFAKAYKMISEPVTKQGWEAARAWPAMTQKERRTHLDTILAGMPKKPLVAPEVHKHITPEVASEIWVMRELGLQGPIPYEDKILGAFAVCMTMKPHPNLPQGGPRTARVGEVKPEVLQKHVNKFKKQMKAYAKYKPACWIALSLDEIGEESICDDPSQLSAIQQMSRQFREMMPGLFT